MSGGADDGSPVDYEARAAGAEAAFEAATVERRREFAAARLRPSLQVIDFAKAPPLSERLREAGWDQALKGQLPLLGAGALRPTTDGGLLVIRQLAARSPWLADLSLSLERDLRLQLALGRPWLRIDPVLLVGPSGAGKSHWAKLLGALSGCGVGVLDLAGSVDAAGLEGTSATWTNARPIWPLTVMAATRCANPVCVVDELDKAGRSERNGDAQARLLGMLEPGTAAAYPDPSFQTTVDLSQVSWVCAANTLDGLPRPLLSRLRVVQVAGPGPEHAAAIMDTMQAELAARWGVPVARLPALPRSVQRTVGEVLAEHRSARAAGRIVAAAIATLMTDRPRALNG